MAKKIIKYKLTDQEMRTYRGFQWEKGKWYTAKGEPEQPLCTNGWFHCYDSPLVAILHNPIHGNIVAPILWEVEVGGKTKNDGGLKRGYQRMKIVRRIKPPPLTTEQVIAYAIICSKEVYKGKKWNKWAERWLKGEERGGAAAWAAAWAAARAAAWAARAAAWAAAWAAEAAWAAGAARVARAAAEAAAWAAYAAEAAARAGTINFVKIAEEAMEYGKEAESGSEVNDG